MNISIKARLTDMGYNVEALSGLEEIFTNAVGNAAAMARNEWTRLAQSRLRSTRSMYLQGLRQAESFQIKSAGGALTSFEITLVGKMPNNIEFGMASFDMKGVRPGWLGGSKARTAKDGHKFVVIPFRHSPSSSAELAYTGKAKAADLQPQLKQAMKDYGLNRMLKTATGQVVVGNVKRIPNKAPVHPYLRGLTRVQSANADNPSKGSAQLLTWRIMSEKSAPDSWVHPGIPAANLLDEVERFINTELDSMLDKIASAA